MRFSYSILVLLLFVSATAVQDKKPKIVGQKNLSVEQQQSLMIQLSDLYVEEVDASDAPGTGPAKVSYKGIVSILR